MLIVLFIYYTNCLANSFLWPSSGFLTFTVGLIGKVEGGVLMLNSVQSDCLTCGGVEGGVGQTYINQSE